MSIWLAAHNLEYLILKRLGTKSAYLFAQVPISVFGESASDMLLHSHFEIFESEPGSDADVEFAICNISDLVHYVLSVDSSFSHHTYIIWPNCKKVKHFLVGEYSPSYPQG